MLANQIDTSRYDLASPELEARLEKLVGPPGEWGARRDLQIRFLTEFGLTPQSRFLDVGCGPLRLGLPLIEFLAPGNYTGVDIDSDCIAGAQQMLDHFDARDRHPNIVQSQDFGLSELSHREGFDMIWVFQVFIHLTEDKVKTALKAISTLLADGGQAYATVNVRPDSDGFAEHGRWRKYVLSSAPLSYYERIAAEAGLALFSHGPFSKNGWSKANPNAERQLHMIRLTKAE